MKDSLTPVLLTVLICLSLWIYNDWNSTCANGMPDVSPEVRNYINSEIAKLKSSADQTSDSKPLVEINQRVLKLQKSLAGIEGAIRTVELFQKGVPPRTFEFKEAPVTVEERLDAATDLTGRLMSRVRRYCMVGGH